jgi:D-alanyl-D-alanine carboxypeptidase (penicillin-binding protein 5/6)
MSHSVTHPSPRCHAHRPTPATHRVSRFTHPRPPATGYLSPATRLLVLLICVPLALLTLGAGGPVLQGSQPGDLPIYPEQIAAYQAAQQLPPLSAQAALLGDSGVNQTLATANAHQPRPMASTTKIMTALLVLERANLADQVVVSPTALVGESSMGLMAGEVLTVEDLLWGLLLSSGNDAAVALAEHVAGSEAAFVQLMNQRAAELGMTNTRFANPHGLDAPDHYSSAYDLWLVAQEALTYPLFRQMVATSAHTTAGRQLFNQNELLSSYPGADGVKTGTTVAAGQNLVGSVTQDGHREIAVILGSQDRYRDAAALFDHFFNFWRWAPAPQLSGPVSWLWTADGRPLHVVANSPPDLFLPLWQWPLVRPILVRTAPTLAPNQPVGVVRWYLGNRLLAEAPATAIEN